MLAGSRTKLWFMEMRESREKSQRRRVFKVIRLLSEAAHHSTYINYRFPIDCWRHLLLDCSKFAANRHVVLSVQRWEPSQLHSFLEDEAVA